METESEIYCNIIRWMIGEVKNKDYIQKLNLIIEGIEGKNFIEETKHPRFQSIFLFGSNLFPFTIGEYREMSKLIKG